MNGTERDDVWCIIIEHQPLLLCIVIIICFELGLCHYDGVEYMLEALTTTHFVEHQSLGNGCQESDVVVRRI